MPRSRRTPSLARLFEQCPVPLYVMDGGQRIVFANSALLEWVGGSKESLIGQRVEYHSLGDWNAAAGIANGLSPPPSAFAGQVGVGTVATIRESGQIAHRRGRFLPLGPIADVADRGASQGPGFQPKNQLPATGVIALLESRDLTSAEVSATEQVDPALDELHRALAQMRRRRSVRGAGVALIGESDAMRRARRQVELAAAMRAPLIVLSCDDWQARRVAEGIAYVRPDSHAETVLPLESELLDANLLQWSLEALADRGRHNATLIFHNVDRLPTDAQVFLAERVARWPAQWQVIATVDRTQVGNWSPDVLDERLFDWFSTLVVDLPKLTARMQDLPLLVQHFVEELNAGGLKQIAGFSQNALERMYLFDWPGGLEQLQAAVAAAHAAAAGVEIQPLDLSPWIAHAETAAALAGRGVEPIVLEKVLEQIEVGFINRALELSSGNKTQAAVYLGMTRPRLYRRLEQLGLEQGENA